NGARTYDLDRRGDNYSLASGDNLAVPPKWSRMLAVASVVGLACATSCFTGTATKVIRIGVDLPLSGADGRAGTPALNGVQFFVHQHPTIDGFSVEVVPRDDAVGGLHAPAQGERNVKSL